MPLKKIALPCLIITCVIGALFFSTFAHAQSKGNLYENIEKIPGANGRTSDFCTYMTQIINFGFAAIGILAMFMLMIGAYQYLMAAGNLAKADSAKDSISSALLGLALGLTAWLILSTINPALVKCDLKAGSASPSTGPGTGAGNTGVGDTNPTKKSDAKCDTVKNYDGFMNKNWSDGNLYNEANVGSAQDLRNVLENIRTGGNGLTQYADTVYQACKDNNVPFWYATGTFAKESNLFSEGNAGCSQYNNPGCMRSGNEYIRYSTPEEGIRANIENMGRRIKDSSTPLETWTKWYDPDGPGNCGGAKEYLDLMSWAAKKTGTP